MSPKMLEQYDLIAKRCPICEALVMAKPDSGRAGVRYVDYRCSSCDWTSPYSYR